MHVATTGETEGSLADAAFIACARDALPAALDDLDAAEAQTVEISRIARLFVGALVDRAGGKLTEAEAALIVKARDALAGKAPR